MKSFAKFTFLAVAITVTSFMQSCQKDDSVNPGSDSGELKTQGTNTFYGPTQPFMGGTARAWVKVAGNGNGEPTAVGIDVSGNVLQNLSEEHASVVLQMPNNKGGNFYTHMTVEWNPEGHLPIYGSPHFDFHFYYIPEADRMNIDEGDAAEFDIVPAEMYWPPMYMKIPGGVPMMGAHWVDLLSPEIAGTGDFTQTFIWGSFDGEFIFFEPMVTSAYLLGNPDVTFPVRQPQAYAQDGWYPTTYSIKYSTSPNKYTISLDELVYHEGQ